MEQYWQFLNEGKGTPICNDLSPLGYITIRYFIVHSDTYPVGFPVVSFKGKYGRKQSPGYSVSKTIS